MALEQKGYAELGRLLQAAVLGAKPNAHSVNNREREEQTDARASTRRTAEHWAERVGFTETQTPWAALCALSMKVGRKGAPVRASDVRARLAQSHPFLFSDPSQLELFDANASGEEAF